MGMMSSLAHHLAEALERHAVSPPQRCAARAFRSGFGQPMLDVDARQRLGDRRTRFGVPRRWAPTSVAGALSALRPGGLSFNSPSCPSGIFSDDGAKRRAQQPHLLLQVLDHRITLCEPGLVLGDDGARSVSSSVVAHLRVQRGDLFTRAEQSACSPIE